MEGGWEEEGSLGFRSLRGSAGVTPKVRGS